MERCETCGTIDRDNCPMPSECGCDHPEVQAEMADFAQWLTEQIASGEDFSAWVAHMKATRNWSARRCSRELGCGVNQVAIWSEKGAPQYIALACAALAYGLPAWRKT